MSKMLLTLRASLFWLGFFLSTLLVGLVSPFLFFVSAETSYKTLIPWVHFNLWWLKLICGVKYTLIGKENIDLERNGLILANHQSTWETLLIPSIFPIISWVLKKELMRIPFFGWGLASAKHIAIDRNSGKSSLEQIKTKGKACLDEGKWVCIFPEGTRVPVGETVRYKKGGAMLAEYCAKQGVAYPVYPLAHNAGECWPKGSYIKYPGMITVSIGKPFSAEGLSTKEINDKVRAWIEAEIEKMPSARL